MSYRRCSSARAGSGSAESGNLDGWHGGRAAEVAGERAGGGGFAAALIRPLEERAASAGQTEPRCRTTVDGLSQDSAGACPDGPAAGLARERRGSDLHGEGQMRLGRATPRSEPPLEERGPLE